jgi:putative restriction endonuclease
MPERVGWTRDQLLIALRLYMTTPFGKLHRGNPDIIALAARIGRTPSALGMKACNFASLDPVFRATNRAGLSGASEADRAIWAEFTADSESVADEAEALADQYTAAPRPPIETDLVAPTGPTDSIQTVRVRRVQTFFRAAVLTTYDTRCAISGIQTPALLVASHIIPWAASVQHRANPTNGLCLNALFDRAFDRGLMTIDENFRVVVSTKLSSIEADAPLGCSLLEAHGRPITLPPRSAPDPAALAFHRENIFVG